MPTAKDVVKEGYKTTEFWISLVVILAATLLCATGKLDADQWSLVAGGSGAGYAISRGLAKK